MIVIVTKKTAVKIQFKLTNRLWHIEDVDSVDDQHQNSSQESQDETYVNPVNQEAPEKNPQNCCRSLQNIKANQIK